ncbi:MAG: hypothetical protein ABEH81_12535 [Halopenitus sp.]
MRNNTRGRRRLVGDVYVRPAVMRWIRATIIGVLTGIVGGLGTFVFSNTDVSPIAGDPKLALIPIVLSGVYAHLFAADLRESFTAAGVAFLVGAVVCIGAWVWPVYALGYTGVLAELVGAPRLRNGVVNVITIYLMVFGASYLATLSLTAVRE